MKNKIWIAIVVAYLAVGAVGQQVSDTAFAPPISSPMYKVGQGPVVLLDEALLTFTPPMDVISRSRRCSAATVTMTSVETSSQQSFAEGCKDSCDRERIGDVLSAARRAK